MSECRFLVTGCAGFIGGHMLELLLAKGFPVVGVDNFSTGKQENLAPVRGRFECIEGDLCDPAVARRAVKGATHVIHLASIPSVPRSVANPLENMHSSVTATVTLFDAAARAGVSRVVQASSSAVYGDDPALPKSEDMLPGLQAAAIMDNGAWRFEYTPKRPGVYAGVMEPEPYWEPAEDRYIIHYTKTYLAAYGDAEGWDEPTGLKTEILPLTRPFGNYAGNAFQGQVLLDGKPVPGAMVEIECYNRDGAYAAPNEYMIAQTVKADANGVFTYGVPFAGWWGFAALNGADERMLREGEPKDVELGAVLWAEFVAPAVK